MDDSVSSDKSCSQEFEETHGILKPRARPARHRFQWAAFVLNYTILVFLAGAFVYSKFAVTEVGWQSCRDLGISTLSTTSALHNSKYMSEGEHPTSRKDQELLDPQKDIFKTRFNGSFDKSSAYTQSPSRQVEELWAMYWSIKAFKVTAHQYEITNPEDPDSGVHAPHGNGPPEYLGTFAAMHQMHCLYNLFKATNLEYYDEERTDLEKDPRNWHQRVNHCVDILRQKLECDRDTSVITYNWVKHKSTPVANFNVERQCRPWNVMIDWANEHEVIDMPVKPSGAPEMDGFP